MFLLGTALFGAVSLDARTIRVRSQQDFDRLDASVEAALSAGEKRIEVLFDKGCYVFSEDHLRLEYPAAEGTTLVLDGNGSMLVGEGEDYVLTGGKARFRGDYLPTDGFCSLETGGMLSPCSPVRKARSFVLPVGNGLYRIRTREADREESACKDLYVVISQWYRSGRYPVTRIRRGYIYFRTEEPLTELNGDLRYGQTYPKYMFYNHPEYSGFSCSGGWLRAPVPRVHRSRASRFLTLWGGSLGRLEIRNFHFAGNGGTDYLIQLFRTEMESAEVSGCRFSGLQDRALSTHYIRNVSFRDNAVEDCFRMVLYLDMFSPGARVYGNTFRNIGCAFDGTAVMESLGADMHVHDNVFVDFTYAGILTGIHFTNENPVSTSGFIENNELYQTEAYRREPSRTLMDCGAIYIGTMNRDLTIRNNYIHDYTGTKDYRGIFGDDGASNVKVYDNVIRNVTGPYSIDFRRVASVETRKDSHSGPVNVGNRIYGNTVDAPIRFEPREGK